MQLLLVFLLTLSYCVAAPAVSNSDVIGPCTVQGGKVYQVDLAGTEPVHLCSTQQSTTPFLRTQLLLVLVKEQSLS